MRSTNITYLSSMWIFKSFKVIFFIQIAIEVRQLVRNKRQERASKKGEIKYSVIKIFRAKQILKMIYGRDRKGRAKTRRRRTTNTKDYLKQHMEIHYCQNFLKYIHICEEFKWSHLIVGENAPTRHLIPQSKTSGARNRLYLVGPLAKIILSIPQTL